VVVVAIVAVGYLVRQERNQPPPREQRPAAPAVEAPESAAASGDNKRVQNVVIHDLEGQVVYRGTVDLQETLERIDQRQRLDFRNDGSTFANREGRLPRKPAGYYKEYVHPTPGLAGPGPQRIVVGTEGEAYYTPDHYRTFKKLR
jgi:guanyl-specific ribonuclease Sa